LCDVDFGHEFWTPGERAKEACAWVVADRNGFGQLACDSTGTSAAPNDFFRSQAGGVPLLVEKWANAGSGTDAMRRQ